ncbi:hypothetical protein ACH5RR_002710 [Cinchona calisaya]|uniref:Uncharacterized protein n=1 Tax=Cinchona calisaya TaxID=153742 RepID=A0ABD3ASW7_9GENT
MKEMVRRRGVNKEECKGPRFGVGSTGKVRVLMMQELDSVTSKTGPSTVPVSVYCCESRKRQVMKNKSDQKNSTTCKTSNASSKRKTAGSVRKRVYQRPSVQSIPMLESEDISLDRTPVRGSQERRRIRMVEIVDLKCGNSEKPWSSPITNQLRRLSFSKLSD